MPLIGLTGRMGCGKDTVCQMMQEWGHERGVEVSRAAFADRLKLSAARLFFPDIELDEAVAWCNGLKEDGVIEVAGVRSARISGREFLQHYGTEAHRRVFGDDFWINAALDEYNPSDPDQFLVVTDARFENEAIAIRSAGGLVVRVNRSVVERGVGHVSERGLSGYLIDFEIDNEGTLSDLYRATVTFMNTEVV